MLRALTIGTLFRRNLRRRFRAKPAGRRVLLHIGAHKTGTSFIQATIAQSRARLPLTHEAVRRFRRGLGPLRNITLRIRSEEQARAAVPELTRLAKKMANRFDRVERLIASHEDLLGPIPSRAAISGLYPFAHITIPAIVTGLVAAGCQVDVVLYVREMKDWRTSIYRYRHLASPNRAFAPRRFAARHGLPDQWDEMVARLRNNLTQGQLHVISFEDDRATGFHGTALYKLWGLSDQQIARLKRLPPQNVSRPETVHPRTTAG